MKPKSKTILILMIGLLSVAGMAQAEARKIMSVLDTGFREDYHPLRGTVSYYDVTDMGTSGYSMADNRLFSVWTGYENGSDANWEETEAMTVNPINGTTYVMGYDSGVGGTTETNGDGNGDWDLYRIDYQTIRNDFIENDRAMGTVYAPTTGADGFDYAGSGTTHPGGNYNMAYTDAISKVGELARNGDQTDNGQNTGGGDYFGIDVDFVNPGRMVVLDDSNYESGAGYADPDNPTQAELQAEAQEDHRIVVIERTSNQNGQANHNATTREGGYNNQTSESWETSDLGLVNADGYVDDNGTPDDPSDDVFVPQGMSEVIDMEYVTRSQEGGVYVDGEPSPPGGDQTVEGVWIAENDTPASSGDGIQFNTIIGWDGGGDDMNVTDVFRADETANTSDNNGDVDWVKVGANGEILYGESGYWNDPQEEPAVLSQEVLDYAYTNGDGETFTWRDSETLAKFGPIPSPSDDDDSEITDGRFVAYDKAENQVYFFDIDSSPDYVTDCYVFDLDTQSFVHEEVDALETTQSWTGSGSIYVTEHGFELFTRGDMNSDGAVGVDDIDMLFSLINDPTNGGEMDAAIAQEWFDLTGEWTLDSDDVAELVQNVLGTEFGDANLDGNVDISDLDILAANWSQSAESWADGDFNGDGLVDISDLDALAANWGFSADMPELLTLEQTVPEPMTLSLLALGGAALMRRRRKAA